ncbi:hypothetical protein BZA77DRAFT_388507 [Pyronema omphalodes]|nr:hypothetical protein BZA77DRAFT_388507 [Pyronema omphalodes]
MHLLTLLTTLGLTTLGATHGTHASGSSDTLLQKLSDPSLHWAEKHLLSEHHISNYDAGAFFTLHDFNQDKYLTRDEILRLYGSPTEPTVGEKIWGWVKENIDRDRDEVISFPEWMVWSRRGGVLKDFGTGVGHHGDDEQEYEIHHFEEFHSGDKEDGSDMVMHQEDLDHLKIHEKAEAEELKAQQIEGVQINLANIPMKFRVKP